MSRLNNGGSVRVLREMLRLVENISFSLWYLDEPGEAFDSIKQYFVNSVYVGGGWSKRAVGDRLQHTFSREKISGFIILDVDADAYFLTPYLWALGVPCANWIHSSVEIIKPYAKTIGFFSRYISQFIVINNSVEKFIENVSKGYEGEKIIILKNGIDTKNFSCKQIASNNFLHHRKNISWIGRYDELKNPLAFIKIAECMRDTAPDIFSKCHFICAGDGHLLEKMQKEITVKNLGSFFTLSGFVPDVREILSETSVFVATTLSESFGLAIAEAMSMNVPVVVSNIIPLRELVEDGVEGNRVPVDDIRQFSEKIIYLLEHPDEAKEIGMRGREKIIKNFSLEKQIESFQSILKNI